MKAPGFTGGSLDRADHVRSDPQAVAAARADPAARLLKLDGLAPMLGDMGGLIWTGLGDAPKGSELLLLGFAGKVPHFVATSDGARAASRPPALARIMEALDREEAADYAAARSLVDWHARNGFCSVCGTATRIVKGGWARQCDACGAEHFPRTDPVVIMIAEHEGRALLGRQPSWPAGRYSALAGFLEVGESIEAAVAREIAEEAGVSVDAVRYIASQPWPFPSSLMIACVAQAKDDAITLDTDELETARWFTRDEVAAAMAGADGAPFLPPPPYAIAFTLLEAWLEESAA